MKILHISKKYPTALGGDAVAVSNLEREQLKHGDKVTVLTSNCKEIKADRRHIKFGLRDTPAALDAITPRRLLSLGALVFKSFKVIRKEKPDVLHTHSVDMAFAASFAARWFKVPMVHTFHILTFPDPHHGWLRRKTERLFLKGAHPQVVTAPNPTDVSHLRKAGIKHSHVLPYGINLKFWSRKRAHAEEHVQNEAFTFVTASRLEEQKGNEYLIRAAAELMQRTSKPFRVVIVGDGSLKDSLVVLAEELGVINRIEFTGRKTPEETRALYASSDAMVIPSLWESGPLTAFEAWAMKLPVIITPVGMFANESINSERMLIVKPGDTESLARAMECVLRGERLRKRLSQKGYEAVQKHSWAEMRTVADGLYKEAILKKHGSKKLAAPAAAEAGKPAKSGHTIQLHQRTVVGVLAVASMAALISASELSPTINTLVTLPLVAFVPGMLALLTLWPRQFKKPAAVASLSAALGLLIVALEGLLLNWLLPTLGHHNPLQAKYLVPAHLLVTLLLGLAYYTDRWRGQGLDRISLRVSWQRTARFVVPLILPLLATAGAYRQNNGASNTVTIICFGAVALMAAWYVWKPKRWSAPWLLFNMALALLLSTSLRSWFVSGFDLSQEFQVFTMALQNQYWDIRALPGNAYNACLSLTTLPVALQQYTGVSPEVIFKFFYQVVFALTAVLAYLISRRFVGQRLAFLAAVLYMAQAQFIGTMPAIGRQEIGLLFFGLILYLLLGAQKMSRGREALLIILASGLVLTHYSSTYVAFMVFGAAAAALFIAKKLAGKFRRFPEFTTTITAGLLARLAVILLVFATIWYAQINQSSGNIAHTLRQATQMGMPNSLLPDTNTSKAQLILGGDQDIAKPENVAHYAHQQELQADIKPASVEKLEQGNAFLSGLADAGRTVLGIILKVVLPLSPLLLLAWKKTRKEAADIAFVGLGAVAVFAAVVILPALSANYNFQRVFQQCLLILAATGLWALWTAIPAGRRVKTVVVTAFVLFYFALSPGSGVVNQLAGNTAPRVTYNSVGEEYSKYYVHEGEMLGAHWLSENCQNQSAWADRYATLRLTAYGGIPYDNIRSDILSAKQGCLYLDRANVEDKLYYATYKKLPVRYTTPDSSFAGYNRIYANSQSQVYSY